MAQKVLEALDLTRFHSDELSALAVLDSWFEKIDTATNHTKGIRSRRYKIFGKNENIPISTAQVLQISYKQLDIADFPQADEKRIVLLEQELKYANAYVENVIAMIGYIMRAQKR